LADLVSRLGEMGAAAIAFDIVFAEPDRMSPEKLFSAWLDQPTIRALADSLPANDEVFAAAIGSSPVIVGHILVNEKTASDPELKGGYSNVGDDPLVYIDQRFKGADVSLAAIEKAAAGNAALNYLPDGDAIVRRVPLVLALGDKLYPTLVSEALRVATGTSSYLIRSSDSENIGTRSGIEAVVIGGVPITTNRHGQIILHYSEPDPERYVPVWKVLDGSIPVDSIAGHIVLIGTSAPGLQDIRHSPLDALPGVEIHAQALEQILNSSYLIRPYWAVAIERFFLVIFALTMIFFVLRSGAGLAAAAGIALTTGAIFLSLYVFVNERLLIDPFIPIMTGLAIYMVTSVIQHLQAEQEMAWINEAFSSYVSPNVAGHLLKNRDQLVLGGERREVTFLFTDLANFTSLVENVDPAELSAILNGYLDGMTQILFRHDGTLDKYVGDAMVVIFSAPVEQPDHAARAITCVREMDTFAQRYSAAQRANGVPFGHTRIGVNSGPAIVGNFGGSGSFDYTGFGDTVNIAARLESVNKTLGTRICVSASTADACDDFTGRPAGRLVLKGTTQGVDTYELLPPESMEDEHIKKYLAAYELMADEDSRALEVFKSLQLEKPNDGLVRFHAERLASGEKGVVVVLEEK
jgi:adenylate cyclase